MNLESFQQSLDADTPPELSGALLALWHDAKGDWQLKVVDLAGQDTGVLNSWSLDLDV